MTDTTNLDQSLLVSARVLASAYSNSLSRVISGRARYPLQAARAALERQLTGIEELLNEGKFTKEPELVASAVVLCSHYFEYTIALIDSRWPKRLQAVRSTPVYTSLVDAGKEAKNARGLQTLLGHLAREAPNEEARIDLFISRMAAALVLYNEFAEAMGSGAGVSDSEKLTRTIVFEPEHKQAAISILSYFGEIVSKKYPDIDVGVRIEQHGTRITLVVETPRGELERIEQELNAYGLVVTGHMQPEAYFSRPGDALMLRHKLEMAQLEVRQTRELLQSERLGYGARIESLETNIEFMRSMLDKAQYEVASTAAALREVAVGASSAVAEQLSRLADLLRNPTESSQHELEAALEAIHRDAPSVVDRLNELFIKGSIQGAAGNFLYAALTSVQKIAM